MLERQRFISCTFSHFPRCRPLDFKITTFSPRQRAPGGKLLRYLWIKHTPDELALQLSGNQNALPPPPTATFRRRTLMDVQNIFGRLIFHLRCNNCYHFQIKVFWRSVRCKFQLLFSELYLLALHLFCLLAGLLLDSWVSRGVNMMWPVKQNNKKKKKVRSITAIET